MQGVYGCREPIVASSCLPSALGLGLGPWALGLSPWAFLRPTPLLPRPVRNYTVTAVVAAPATDETDPSEQTADHHARHDQTGTAQAYRLGPHFDPSGSNRVADRVGIRIGVDERVRGSQLIQPVQIRVADEGFGMSLCESNRPPVEVDSAGYMKLSSTASKSAHAKPDGGPGNSRSDRTHAARSPIPRRGP